AVALEAFDAGEAVLDERNQLRLDHAIDRSAVRLQLADVADELDYVAQPLLGVDGDTLAARGLPRGPLPLELRAVERRAHQALRVAPAAGVDRPAFLQAPAQQQREREVEFGQREFGQQLERAAQVAFRLFELGQIEQRRAEDA